MNEIEIKDFGTFNSKFEIKDKVFHIYKSEERLKINPFNVRFPLVIKLEENDIYFSLSPTLNIKELKNKLIKSDLNIRNETNLRLGLKNIFNVPILKVNLYFLKSVKTNYNTEISYFNKIRLDDLELLTKKSSLTKSKLINLNSNNRIYLLKRNNEITGYGLITRENDDYVEISVSTLKKHRNKGLGFKIVNSMTEIITNYGKSVIYVTEEQNIASNKIALKVGYKLIANEFIGYEKICV